MLIRNRWFEVEVRWSVVYARVGGRDACIARDASGWVWTLGDRASFIAS